MLRQELAGTEALLPAVDMSYVLQVLTISIVVMVLCWWAFAMSGAAISVFVDGLSGR